MADFRRGIKAGVVAGIVYMAIAGILGAIYHDNPWSIPHFIWGTGLTLFTWGSLTDPSSVISLLFQNVVRGIIFGAVFAALYSFVPGTASVKKGVVLSAFLCIVALVEAIYTTPGWPIDGISFVGAFYGGRLNLSSFSLALAGIISALIFGALTGFLWDRFQGKELTEERKGSAVLLVSFIFGVLIWVYFATGFILVVVISREIPAIEPGFWWFDLLTRLVVFIGLPGWVLARVAWKKTKVDKSGLMLFPGVLAIIGGVLSRRKPATEPVTAAIAQ